MHERRVQFWRLLRIDEEIRAGRYPTAEKLAALFEVSRRTIERDIEFLRDRYDAPIDYDAKRRGYFYASETFFLKSLFLSDEELFAVAVFEKTLRQYRNTPIEVRLQAVFSKLAALLPEDLVSVSTLWLDDGVTFISEPAPAIEPEIFEAVFSAVKRKRALKFFYRSLEQNEPSLRVCEPYHIVCQRGAWYVIGRCREKNDVRIFAFSRMSGISLLERDAFEVPEDFKLTDYIDTNVGVWLGKRTPFTVRLLFSPAVGVFAEEHLWSDEQKVKVLPDKSVEVSFSTTQFEEIMRFCLGQGATVKVLEPPELVQAVRKEAAKVAGMYNNEEL